MLGENRTGRVTLVLYWPETTFRDAETLRDGLLACPPRIKPLIPPVAMAVTPRWCRAAQHSLVFPCLG